MKKITFKEIKKIIDKSELCDVASGGISDKDYVNSISNKLTTAIYRRLIK